MNLLSTLPEAQLPQNSEPHKIHRSKFTESEDQYLLALVNRFGTKSWSTISSIMRSRTSRQCRDRWNHYLSPTTNKDDWSTEEDEVIIEQLKKVGKQWTYIASLLPGRTSIAVRNRSCKLARRRDTDSYVRNLLKDEYKKKSERICFVPEPSDSKPSQKVLLPSCNDLLAMINGSPVSNVASPLVISC